MNAESTGRSVSSAEIGGSEPDYTSIAAWESGEQGVPFDLQVGIVDRLHLSEIEPLLSRSSAAVGNLLLVGDWGSPLVFIADGTVERLSEDLSVSDEVDSSPQAVDQVIDAFWDERFDVPVDEQPDEIRKLVRQLSRQVAERIAENPALLDAIDARKVEELMAEVFDGLGFSVTLTRETKDGGKDLILEFTVESEAQTFVAEVKHWRSGKRVGDGVVHDFFDVVVRGFRAGGLILSTSGFSRSGERALAEVERRRVIGGSAADVVSLCRLYYGGAGDILTPAMVWARLEDASHGRTDGDRRSEAEEDPGP